jgi:hypothetical protein
MADRTILKPLRPRFAIGEVVYSAISAKKGFIEPLTVAKVEFLPARNQYNYSFSDKSRFTIRGGKKERLMPITLLESELITLCYALDTQISVIQREYDQMSIRLNENCEGQEVDRTAVRKPVRGNGQVVPPNPLYGYNEVVYLTETAQTVGRLEAYKITNFRWDDDVAEWIYEFVIKPRPRRNTTIGDMDDLRRGTVLEYPESMLCTICEAITMARDFLERVINRAVLRKQALCSGTD